MEELKHVIALLLEDAKRLQDLEPNAGTEARIWVGKNALESSDNIEMAIKEITVATENNPFTPDDSSFKGNKITPLTCDGVNRVYHETMVEALRMEIKKLESRIHRGIHSVSGE